MAKLGVWVILAGAIPNDLASPVRGKASFFMLSFMNAISSRLQSGKSGLAYVTSSPRQN